MDTVKPPFKFKQSQSRQSRTVTIKTISKVALLSCIDHYAGRWAWIEHPAQGDTPVHYHAVLQWDTPRYISDVRNFLAPRDPHYYCDSVKSFKGALRYLIHKDNREKVQLPFEAIQTNMKEIVADACSTPTNVHNRDKKALLQYLVDHRGDNAHTTFVALLEKGYTPSDIVGTVNALSSLEKYCLLPGAEVVQCESVQTPPLKDQNEITSHNSNSQG